MRDDETQVHIEARPTDAGPFEVVGFWKGPVQVLDEHDDRSQAIDSAKEHALDDWRAVKVEVAS